MALPPGGGLGAIGNPVPMAGGKEGLVEEAVVPAHQRGSAAAAAGLWERVGDGWVDVELGHLCSSTPLYRGVHHERILR